MLLATFSELSVSKQCGRIFLFVTLGIAVIIAIIALITKLTNPDKLKDFAKYVIGLCIGYATAIIVCMAFFTFRDMVADGEFIKELFYPILSLVLTIFVLVVLGLIFAFLYPKALKIYKFVALGVVAVPLVVTVVFLSLYFKNTVIPGGYYTNVSNVGLIISTVILLAILISVPLFFGKKPKQSQTKSLVYAAVCIAMSFALSYIRLFKLPQGGSVTFVSLLPLIIYSYVFGIRKGVTAGLIYGVLQALQDPYIIHPAQFLLDYPLAFAMIGLSGIFAEWKVFKKIPVLSLAVGSILAGILRYLCHVLSGVFAFSVYAEGTGLSPLPYSLAYNSFVFVDIAITIVVGCLMLSSKSFRKTLEKINQ